MVENETINHLEHALGLGPVGAPVPVTGPEIAEEFIRHLPAELRKLISESVPTHDNILILYDRPEEYYGGGLIKKPESAQNIGARATSLLVGPGRRRDDGSVIPMTVKVGQRLCVQWNAGWDIQIGQEDNDKDVLRICNEQEVLLILPNGALPPQCPTPSEP